jgi:hypothetical protein
MNNDIIPLQTFIGLAIPRGQFNHYCALTLGGEPTHYWCIGPDELIRVILQTEQSISGTGKQLYVAMSGFQSNQTRKGWNADYRRSLSLDLDVKPGKEFESKEDALTRLAEFCASAGLPWPLLIESGNGFHCHWCCEENIEIEDWDVLASRLAAACVANKFPTDTTVTTDRARVLRPPGCLWKKETPHFMVRMVNSMEPMPLAAIQAALRPFKDMATKVATHRATGTREAITLGGINPYKLDETPANIRQVAGWMNHIGHVADYPEWRDLCWSVMGLGWGCGDRLLINYHTNHAGDEHASKWESGLAELSKSFDPARCPGWEFIKNLARNRIADRIKQ